MILIRFRKQNSSFLKMLNRKQINHELCYITGRYVAVVVVRNINSCMKAFHFGLCLPTIFLM